MKIIMAMHVCPCTVSQFCSVWVYFFCGCLGNTKVITQSALQTFQEEMGKVIKDPYKVNMYLMYVGVKVTMSLFRLS